MLEIKNIHAQVGGKSILKGVNLRLAKGQCHAIMGPNGAGKSTLANLIAGHPAYEITEGDILFQGMSLNELSPEERAHLGLFMSFQYPVEISGVSNLHFLHACHSSLQKAKKMVPLSLEAFEKFFEDTARKLHMRNEFKDRGVNEGFSGGEKKRNEILQMLLLDPVLAVLDETDSGLDIDALKRSAEGIQTFRTDEKTILLITHYQRLLEYVKPDQIHVMIEGRIAYSGGPEIAQELEKNGYHFLQEKKLC